MSSSTPRKVDPNDMIRCATEVRHEMLEWIEEQEIAPNSCTMVEFVRDGDTESVRFHMRRRPFRFSDDKRTVTYYIDVLKPSRPCPWPFENLVGDVDECAPV